MNISASTLRQNVYKTLDEIVETGKEVKINRKGKKLKIILDSSDKGKQKNNLLNLKKRKITSCREDDLIYIDWYSKWKI